VAIKIVDKAGIANVEDVERVYRETFILTTLKVGHTTTSQRHAHAVGTAREGIDHY
jgi:hypothetical protein